MTQEGELLEAARFDRHLAMVAWAHAPSGSDEERQCELVLRACELKVELYKERAKWAAS